MVLIDIFNAILSFMQIKFNLLGFSVSFWDITVTCIVLSVGAWGVSQLLDVDN